MLLEIISGSYTYLEVYKRQRLYIFLHIVGAPFISIYAYLCIALGFGLYYKMISKYFAKILSILVNGVVKLLRMIFNYIIYPFQLIIKGKNKN